MVSPSFLLLYSPSLSLRGVTQDWSFKSAPCRLSTQLSLTTKWNKNNKIICKTSPSINYVAKYSPLIFYSVFLILTIDSLIDGLLITIFLTINSPWVSFVSREEEELFNVSSRERKQLLQAIPFIVAGGAVFFFLVAFSKFLSCEQRHQTCRSRHSCHIRESCIVPPSTRTQGDHQHQASHFYFASLYNLVIFTTKLKPLFPLDTSTHGNVCAG